MSDSPSDKTDYFLQILDTIGKPLIVPVLKQGDGAPEETAKHLAELLAKSVQASIDLGPLVEIEKLGDQSDSVRVALAGLSSHILAGLYDHFGRMPADSDIKKINDGLQAAISFADNFTASPESTMRAASVEAGGQAVDSPQSSVQFLRSFVPVIQAVSGFSFGKPEATLISEIAQKLTAKASEIGATHYAGTHKGDDLKAVERGILHTLAEIYAASHEAETKRMSSASDRDEAGGSLDTVWKAFETQVQILEALIQSIVPGGASAATGSVAPSAPEATTPAETADKPAAPASPIAGIVAGAKGEEAKAETPAAPAAPAKETKPAAPPSGNDGNPMSFFSGPTGDGGDEPAKPTAETPAPATETPPPAQPPATPPAEPPAQEEGGEEKSSGNSGNPMSFFSGPKKDGDDE